MNIDEEEREYHIEEICRQRCFAVMAIILVVSYGGLLLWMYL